MANIGLAGGGNTTVFTKLWVDDLRPPPDAYPREIPKGSGHTQMWSDTWIWVRTSKAAMELLDHIPYEEVSLDHDLGGDDTTRPIVLSWCQNPWAWPKRICVHSVNPIGAAWLVGMIDRYAPAEVEISQHGILHRRYLRG